MCRKIGKNRFSSALGSGVGVVFPSEVSEAHLEAAKLLEEWAATRGSFVVEGQNHNTTFNVDHAVGLFEAFYGASRWQWEMRRSIEDSPQRAECLGDEDYFLREKDSESLAYSSPDRQLYGAYFPSFEASDAANVPCKRFAHANFMGECERGNRDLINKLPDELLCEIFRFLPRARDRAVCGSVSMRWLMLQSHMHKDEFKVKRSRSDGYGASSSKTETDSEAAQEGSEEGCDKAFSHASGEYLSEVGVKAAGDERRVERQPQWAIGDLSRCLEGKKATDVRLASIAVGTGARGGLGKLSIRGGSKIGLEKGVTDIGLSAIGFCCSALRNLSLWDCPNIGDEGLSVIGKGCRLLEKVDLLKCPSVGDSGLQSIAKNCPLLSCLSLDECGLIGNGAMRAIGECCPGLLSLNIRNCPLIGDEGIVAVVFNAKKLKTMKLEGVRMGDSSMAFIGQYCKALLCLSLHNLELVTEEGFILFGKASGMQKLKRFAVTSCNGFSDGALGVLGDCCSGLKHLSLVKCERVTDQGLSVFMQTAASLEVLQLERCNRISGNGLTAAFSTSNGKLRKVQIKKCDGIQDSGSFSPAVLSRQSTVKSICLSQCRGVGNMCLALVGYLCRQVTELDLSGLANISDEGLLAFLQSGKSDLASVNVSGCVKLTDWAVCAIAEQCGGSLRNLVLDGCKMVTDKSLVAVAKQCVSLEDLDVSQCSVSDKGVMALVAKAGPTLSSLNLSGCGGITDKILPLIEEKCQGLVLLNLKNCQGLTRKVIDSFESRLWKCDVFWS